LITIKQRGTFKHTENWLERIFNSDHSRILNRYGAEGVAALAASTPVDSGETAASWSYTTHVSRNRLSVSWHNSHIDDGAVVAILLQYGHGTKNGGYVQGRDYINPAILPIFDRLADELWREVTT
jgi:hypothetical protein